MTKIQVRRGSSAQWAASANPILFAGEEGYDTTVKDSKIGDGVTTWAQLPFRSSGRFAYVEDYLASNRVPGVTDDRPAFEAARLTGKPVRAGVGTFYLSRSPDWGDNSYFRGAGKGKTIIKLLDSAPGGANLWVNASLTGTVNGYFADFTLDGNCYRQGGTLSTDGGSTGSTFTLRNCRYFYVERVSAINPMQHAFDVTRGSIGYAYVGDGVQASLRSSDCYFDKIDGSGFGDDGFTTHSSDYIHVSNSIFFNPRLRDNCNGIEIDGDSRYCTASNNRTYNCYAGIEIKGHGSESAAQGIEINGHIDTGSVRSYNFRHIGFHSGSDPVSLTANNIIATNLTSINPNNDMGFQDDATPRALAISAYHGVVINGFTAIGKGSYGPGEYAVAIQYRAKNITISGLNISGWNGAEQDIAITSGDLITISGTIENSAKRAVYVGSTITTVNIMGLIATAPTDGSALHGLDLYNETSANAVEQSSGVVMIGYPNAVRANGVNYTSWGLFKKRIRDTPADLTRLIDLDPRYTYYASTGVMSVLTDNPGLGGAGIVSHSDVSNVYVQTVTRNTTLTTSQGRAWRIAYTDLTSGPWNHEALTSDIPSTDVLDIPDGTTRLVDLDLTRNYYGTTGMMDLITDGPNLGGAGMINHVKHSQDAVVQSVTRNTTNPSIQAKAWRIVYPSTLGTGPWNREVLATNTALLDTGFRNVGGDVLLNGWTAADVGDIIVSRDGNMVHFSAKVNSTSATADGVIQLPLGFRPQAADYLVLATFNYAGTGRWGRILPDGTVSIARVSPLGAHYISGTWKTRDAWPTTLPGVARP